MTKANVVRSTHFICPDGHAIAFEDVREILVKDYCDANEHWTWMDANGIVHATGRVRDDDIHYWTSALACTDEDQNHFIRCNLPVTCVVCLSKERL